MRGRGGRPRGNSVGRGPTRVFVPHIPFDFVLCEQAFPRVKALPNDDEFTKVILYYMVLLVTRANLINLMFSFYL